MAVSAAEESIDEPEHFRLLWRVLLPSVVDIFCGIELRMNRKVADGITSVTLRPALAAISELRFVVYTL